MRRHCASCSGERSGTTKTTSACSANIFSTTFSNRYTTVSRASVHQSKQRKPPEPPERERAHSVKRQLKARVQEEAKLILLDLLMPNGKTLRNCTGADCECFGGWFTRLAKHVPAKKLVGDVLNERDVRKLWQR